jgi:hypothetical protein
MFALNITPIHAANESCLRKSRRHPSTQSPENLGETLFRRSLKLLSMFKAVAGDEYVVTESLKHETLGCTAFLNITLPEPMDSIYRTINENLKITFLGDALE